MRCAVRLALLVSVTPALELLLRAKLLLVHAIVAHRPWTRGMYVLSSPRLTTASPDRKEKNASRELPQLIEACLMYYRKGSS